MREDTNPDEPIYVPGPMRWLMGLLIVAGAIGFGLIGWLLFRAPATTFPSPLVGPFLAAFFEFCAFGFGFIGIRLLVMRTADERLLTPRASVGAGIGAVLFAGFVLVLAAAMRSLDAAALAIFPFALGAWLFKSGRKRQQE